MDGTMARNYFQVFQAMVGAAYLMHQGREREQALLRAWHYYALPILDAFWLEDSHPVVLQVAHQLMGWLHSLHEVRDPESAFRRMVEAAQAKALKRKLRKGWLLYPRKPNP